MAGIQQMSYEELLSKFIDKQLSDGTVLQADVDRCIACTAHFVVHGREYALPAILMMRYSTAFRVEDWRLLVLLKADDDPQDANKDDLIKWVKRGLVTWGKVYLSTPKTGRTDCLVKKEGITREREKSSPIVALFSAEVPNNSPLRILLDETFVDFGEEVQR